MNICRYIKSLQSRTMKIFTRRNMCFALFFLVQTIAFGFAIYALKTSPLSPSYAIVLIFAILQGTFIVATIGHSLTVKYVKIFEYIFLTLTLLLFCMGIAGLVIIFIDQEHFNPLFLVVIIYQFLLYTCFWIFLCVYVIIYSCYLVFCTPGDHPKGASTKSIVRNITNFIYQREDEDSCCICLEAFKQDEELVRMHCEHMFHEKCVTDWLKLNATCPMCRSKLEKQQS